MDDLRKLLSAKHQKQLAIMEYLLQHTCASLEQLEKVTNSSKRTLISYLEELERRTDFFSIEKKKNSYVLLKNKSMSYSTIYHYLYQESIQLNVLEYIFLHPFATTNEILQVFGLSSSQFRRIKNRLICCLESHQIYLSTSPFHFLGEFKKLSCFFLLFHIEKYHFLECFTTRKELTVINQFVSSFSHLNVSFCEHYKEHLKIHIWVTIKLSGHFPGMLTVSSFSSFDSALFFVDYLLFEKVFKVSYSRFLHSKLSELYLTLSQNVQSDEKKKQKEAFAHFRTSIYHLLGEDTVTEFPLFIDPVFEQFHGKYYILNNSKQRFVTEFFRQYSCFPAVLSQQLMGIILNFKKKIEGHALVF
ncbi:MULTISPECIES: helix-turn-helix domain-containing protein [unclassified Enterococcus]|uniref:helix-turn-helix domain-containing protein n=1 Tax=unclassified Enterococcus TaxID=2608891 RepID=UPI0013EB0D5F|nr:MULTISPECIES: helix-turn-helix domain-containing protein [unclassified Enterococcus]